MSAEPAVSFLMIAENMNFTNPGVRGGGSRWARPVRRADLEAGEHGRPLLARQADGVEVAVDALRDLAGGRQRVR